MNQALTAVSAGLQPGAILLPSKAASIILFLRDRFSDIPPVQYPMVGQFLAEFGAFSDIGRALAVSMLKKLRSCPSTRRQLVSDCTQLLTLRSSLNRWARDLCLPDINEMDNLVLNTVVKANRDSISDVKVTGSLLEYASTCQLDTKVRNPVLRVVKNRLTLHMASWLSDAEIRKPKFRLFQVPEDEVDLKVLFPLILRYLDFLNRIGAKIPFHAAVDFNRNLHSVLETSVELTDIEKLEIISLHSGLGFPNLKAFGRTLVPDWLRSHRNLSGIDKTVLTKILACARNVDYKHRFGVRRLGSACRRAGLLSEQESLISDELHPILLTNPGLIRRNRCLRKLYHEKSRKLTVRRLSKASVEKLKSLKYECRCRICETFRKNLDLAIAFHFP